MLSRNTGSNTFTHVVGLVVLGLVGGVLYLAATAHTGLPWSETSEVQAAFNDTASLKPGDEVRQFGARIGNVTAVDYVDDRAVVTMKLDGNREVYTDATAEIGNFSALAQKYIELDVGTPEAGELGDEEVVSADRTTDSNDLHELLNVFDKPTREATGQALRELGGGLAGDGQNLSDFYAASPDLLSDTRMISGALVSDTANLPNLLRQTDQIASRFVDRRGDIEATVRQFGETMAAVSVDGGQPLRDSLRQLPSTLDQAQRTFHALDRPLGDLESAFAKLEPGFAGLGKATPDTRGVLREGLQPLGRIPGVAEDAEPALEDLTPAVADARPLAAPLRDGLNDLQEPMDVLQPYAPELGYLLVRLHSFVSESVAPGVHYARVNANVGLPTVLSGGLKDKFFFPHNPYPEPGEATFDRAGGIGGN